MRQIAARVCDKKLKQVKQIMGVKTNQEMVERLMRHFIQDHYNKELRKQIKRKGLNGKNKL